jgi:hypothetical protein
VTQSPDGEVDRLRESTERQISAEVVSHRLLDSLYSLVHARIREADSSCELEGPSLDLIGSGRNPMNFSRGQTRFSDQTGVPLEAA